MSTKYLHLPETTVQTTTDFKYSEGGEGFFHFSLVCVSYCHVKILLNFFDTYTYTY